MPHERPASIETLRRALAVGERSELCLALARLLRGAGRVSEALWFYRRALCLDARCTPALGEFQSLLALRGPDRTLVPWPLRATA